MNVSQGPPSLDWNDEEGVVGDDGDRAAVALALDRAAAVDDGGSDDVADVDDMIVVAEAASTPPAWQSSQIT